MVPHNRSKAIRVIEPHLEVLCRRYEDFLDQITREAYESELDPTVVRKLGLVRF